MIVAAAPCPMLRALQALSTPHGAAVTHEHRQQRRPQPPTLLPATDKTPTLKGVGRVPPPPKGVGRLG